MPQPPKLPYTLDEEKKHEFARLYLLDYMIEEEPEISIMLDEHNEDLEPLFEELMARELIEIDKSQCYRVSKKGVDRHRRFLKRYREMMAINDIFCAVDLATGEFAFSYYDDYPDRRSWENFLSQPRWDDLRIAVAEYLGEDPIELVFMSFINEKRFGRDANGKWQFDLLLGTIWDEILEICNTAIHWPDLGYEDDEGFVPAEDVIEDIIAQGNALRQRLTG
ncbi:MAG: hypothetical protein GXO34_07130 [Deltaproteobacteria bacterium]|nr:hypothetical protein [Deltaproteobacteria bacterium]